MDIGRELSSNRIPLSNLGNYHAIPGLWRFVREKSLILASYFPSITPCFPTFCQLPMVWHHVIGVLLC